MNIPIQDQAEILELKREIPFRSTPKDETNEETTTGISDHNTMLTMIVLLLARIGGNRLCHRVPSVATVPAFILDQTFEWAYKAFVVR